MKDKTWLKHKTILFFSLVFAFSAPFWLWQFLIKDNSLPLNIPVTDVFAVLAPTLAAVILSWRENGLMKVKQLFQTTFITKGTRWQFLLYALLLPVFLFLMIYGLTWMFFSEQLPPQYTLPLSEIPLLIFFFFLGAVAEEIGYSGYVYKEMKARLGVIRGALVLGLLWSVWHYPSMLQQGRSLVFFLWGTLGTVAFRFIYCLFLEWSNFSVLSVVLMHTFYNVCRMLFPSDQTRNALVQIPELHYGAALFLATVCLLLWKRKGKTE